jgi:hypothetical protein
VVKGLGVQRLSDVGLGLGSRSQCRQQVVYLHSSEAELAHCCTFQLLAGLSRLVGCTTHDAVDWWSQSQAPTPSWDLLLLLHLLLLLRDSPGRSPAHVSPVNVPFVRPYVTCRCAAVSIGSVPVCAWPWVFDAAVWTAHPCRVQHVHADGKYPLS